MLEKKPHSWLQLVMMETDCRFHARFSLLECCLFLVQSALLASFLGHNDESALSGQL